jgi:hypothetical protein
VKLQVGPMSPSRSSTKGNDKRIGTHRILIVATLLLCSSFIVFNVHVGYKSLETIRNHKRMYEHNYDSPHLQQHNLRRKISTSNSRQQEQMEVLPIVEHLSIHDGKYLSQLLRGEIEFRRDETTIHRYKFKPGSLDMSSTDSLQHCRVNTTQYEEHFATKGRVLVSVSERYKIIYRNIPKSASSSSRHAMQNLFDGEDVRMKVQELKSRVEKDGYQVISFIRDPLDRFYSSYDEAYFRKGPWFGEGRLVENRPGEVKGYHKTKHKVEPYPYLYAGMKTYDDYRDKFCDKGSDKECKTAETIDDGDLTRRFEMFVNDYSGTDPFDVHLSMQVPFLAIAETGDPLPISVLYNASYAERDWLSIAKQNGVDVPADTLVHGRKTPRRFNMSLVTDATKKKICKILMLDYCCLNLELPDVCKYNMSEEEANGLLSCSMETRGGKHYITPWK